MLILLTTGLDDELTRDWFKVPSTGKVLVENLALVGPETNRGLMVGLGGTEVIKNQVL